MSVTDIRFKFILVFFMLFPSLLLSFSSAYPDLTFYNNYLTGVSPFVVNGEDVFYAPNNGEYNYSATLVTSFSNTYMHGTEIPSAVPYLNVDYTVGKVWELPSNSLMVVGSDSGDQTFLSHNTVTGGNLHVVYLGTSYPSVLSYTSEDIHNADNICYDTAGEAFSDYVRCGASGNNANLTTFFNNKDDFFLYSYISNPSSDWIRLSNSYLQNGQQNFSFYILLYNSSPNSVKFSVEYPSYISTHPVDYVAPYVSAENFTGIVNCYSYDASINNTYGVYSFLPHINGNIDIYSLNHSFYNSLQLSNSSTYRLNTHFNLSMEMYETVEGYLVVGIKNAHGNTTRDYARINYNMSFLDYDSSLVPIFLNNLFGMQSRAIWIKDGYIAINNYDELVEKLRNSGFTGDLARVIALLEEINTGGETGEAVKQLMDILEQSHATIVESADDDFGTIYEFGWTQWKHLLDFSGDTIHWIVTANNALFNYFSGFIILCAFFLVIDRIMRG